MEPKVSIANTPPSPPSCQSVRGAFERLAASKDKLHPATLLFLECPTNPDMKVMELTDLQSIVDTYTKATGKTVMVLFDTTFAPGSHILERTRKLAPDLPAMVFISMSKSVSRGYTTAGTIVANHTEFALGVLARATALATALDTTAKPDQMQRLVDNHGGVEERCKDAYGMAVALGTALCDGVFECTGKNMELNFVSPQHAALGYHTSTFSFNLPPPEGASTEQIEGLAQKFVDHLTEVIEPRQFKPCVSFGQDNGLVYCTVPATSTQGAIKAEDKAKQAVGGVQLVRLSFPPSLADRGAAIKHVGDSVRMLYGK